MRWERLFEDLEASAQDLVRDERDALADDLRDELWAERTWLEMFSGPVAVTVAGVGEVAGQAQGASDQFVRLLVRDEDVLVAVAAVMAVSGPVVEVSPRLRAGWGSVFRALRDDGESIQVTRRDGTVTAGEVVAVAQDAVVLTRADGRVVTIPWSAIALVRRRR